MQSADVNKDMRVTHLEDVVELQHHLHRPETRATPTHVGPMLMPESVAVPVSAAVDQNTSETPTVAADLSVWSTLTVPPPRPVSTSTVLILVPEFVASMPSVGSSITILSVPVCLVTLETHLEAAVLNRWPC